jgi:hypothetical protein
MDADTLKAKLEAAGAYMSTEGEALVVDLHKFTAAFLDQLAEIERLSGTDVGKAVLAERERCAAIADKANQKDERDNGIAMTGAAEIAAQWIRNGVDDR